jgi:hypothetical protein
MDFNLLRFPNDVFHASKARENEGSLFSLKKSYSRFDSTVPYSSPFQGIPPQICLTLLSSPIQWPFDETFLHTFRLAHTYLYPSYSLLLHLGPLLATTHSTLKMDAERSSETSLSYTTLYGVTTQKTSTRLQFLPPWKPQISEYELSFICFPLSLRSDNI